MDTQNKLGMSMFANREDYESAVVAYEGYNPTDAFNDGEGACFDGFGKNPYSAELQPICFAAWDRGFNGKPGT